MLLCPRNTAGGRKMPRGSGDKLFPEAKMKITQMSVFIENTKGKLYELCAILGANNINIKALTLAESPEFGIVRLVVDRAEEAVKLLKENGFIASMADIVAVEVSDTPGGLAAALKILLKFYNFPNNHDSWSVYIFI